MYIAKRRLLILFIPLVLVGTLVVTGLYYTYTTYTETSTALGITKAMLASTTQDLQDTRIREADLADKLATSQTSVGTLTQTVLSVIGANDQLTKLTHTDKELLQKYSRVYFLSENYVPETLSAIASTSLYQTTKTTEFHTKALPYLTQMLADAQANGTPLLVISGYRSFKTQSALKVSYKVIYGSGSNTFSADQGYSEHQLGTAVDLTTKEVGATFSGFSKTPAYDWLVHNAYRYGFILSYPPNNSYYQYEPWHWRFVGVALATRLHTENLYFYDLPQREIDNYLLSIFDAPPQ